MTGRTILKMWLVVSVFSLAVTGVARAQWLERDKLLASDGDAVDWFGESVSISGDYAIVGAYGDDDNGIESGSAYVFKREAGVWIQQAKLLASDGASGDNFGGPVSISGDYAIVGAVLDEDNGYRSGSAYVFEFVKTCPIDIRPASCFNPLNVQNDDILPVAVLGTEELDVNDIDMASIRLADVAPFRSNYLDITGPESNEPNACGCTATCPDDYTDIWLKFRTVELVEVLTEIYGEINEGDELELTLTAVLYDGSPIVGTDYITVVGEVPHRLNNPDLNNDELVNFLDFAIMAEYWLTVAP